MRLGDGSEKSAFAWRWADVRGLVFREGTFLAGAGLGVGIGVRFVPLYILGYLIPGIHIGESRLLYGEAMKQASFRIVDYRR